MLSQRTFTQVCSIGMNVAAGPKLAAAVTNAGGIGVIGGLRQNPKMLQESINEIKAHLEDKNAPFGIDLLIPQVGGNARRTNVCTCANLNLSSTNLCLYSTTTPRVNFPSSQM